MRRRKFLQLTALGTVVLAVPSAVFATMSLKDAAVGFLINEYDYLSLDKKGVESFVDDFFAFDSYWNTSLKYNMVVKTSYATTLKSKHAARFLKDDDMLKKLAESYLLSSDYFINKMNDSKPVKYVALYNPHLRPCANPFSFIHYPAEVS